MVESTCASQQFQDNQSVHDQEIQQGHRRVYTVDLCPGLKIIFLQLDIRLLGTLDDIVVISSLSIMVAGQKKIVLYVLQFNFGGPSKS